MGILYYKLVAFIPNTKDVWDFCLDGLNAKLKKLFKEIDWTKYASLATNSCYHLGKSHIFQALYDHLDILKDN